MRGDGGLLDEQSERGRTADQLELVAATELFVEREEVDGLPRSKRVSIVWYMARWASV